MSTYILRKNRRIHLTDMPVDTSITSGTVLAMGDSTTQITSDTADTKFIEARFDSGASSGDNRGMYLRLYHTGASTGGGEALRAFTSVNANIANAHGAHISLNFVATAGGSECSGQGIAGRFTLHIPNVASWAPTGTYSALQAEIYSDGSNSDPAGMTKLSFLRIVNGGDADGRADVDDDAFLMELSGFTADSGHTVGANTEASTTLDFANWIPLKIDIGGTTHYIVAAQTVAATGA